ncbi:hypothetical protein CL628_02520 [bacterium]|nr:hypothetical protein [bacterium]|tara:strand:- start:247 stop:561 length:315 start_codon:yes stop_codon:yes gene_type:complete
MRLNIKLSEVPGLVRSLVRGLPQLVLLDHFGLFIRGIVVVLFAVIAVLALSIVLTQTDPLQVIESQIKPLDTNTLERVIIVLDERVLELPKTIIGNRREFLIRP